MKKTQKFRKSILFFLCMVTMCSLFKLVEVRASENHYEQEFRTIAPTGLKLFNPQNDTILLEWNTLSGASQYGVYMSTTSSENYQLLCVVNKPTIVLKGFKENQTYYFKVSAIINGVQTQLSSTVSGKSNIKGIDVSHWNGQIDWNRVKQSGQVDFAIIRVGYGDNISSQDDRNVTYNIENCERAGIPTGYYLYSYAKNTSQALSEANHMLRLLNQGARTAPYGIWYDMEDSSTISVGSSGLGNIAQTFHNQVSAYGYQVGIYANKYWFENILVDHRFNNWVKWVAQYNSQCTYNGVYIMWQYTSKGSIDGINGDVDLNYAYTGREKNLTGVYSYDIRNGYQTLLESVTGVKVSTLDYKQIKISWNLEKGATRYEVLRSLTSDGEYQVVGQTTTNVWIDTTALPNKNYYYKVKAYSFYDTTVTSKTQKSTAFLQIPTSLKVTSTSVSATLSWNKTVNAQYYEVYRSTSLSKGYKKIANVKSTDYTDNQVQYNQTYYYKIRAVVKVPTRTISGIFTNPVTTKIIIRRPDFIQAERITSDSAKISYPKVTGATKYRIYRSESLNGAYSCIATTTDTNYVDNKISSNKKYYYKVKSVYDGQNFKYYSSFTSAAVVNN